MPTFLLVFEFLGTTELLVIAVVALIIFGPRKLPEIGRTIGKSLAEFKRASEDFKRTWESEVDLERSDRESRIAPPDTSAGPALAEGNGSDVSNVDDDVSEGQTIARESSEVVEGEATGEDSQQTENVESSKKDWL
jgi:TatA/E family protein of Tat protein translocase